MLIAIIGGGASGMAAALAAAEDPGNRVVLLERQARLGRKLQATGNGRCNLSNLHAGQEGYHGDTPGFSRFALTQFPPERTLEWFGALGLYAVAEESGRVYPYSDQANSVVDVLRFALEKPNIRLELGCEVEKIRKTAKGFRLEWRPPYRGLRRPGGYKAGRLHVRLSAAAQPGASLYPSAAQSGAGENGLGRRGSPQGRPGQLPGGDPA